MYFTTTIAAAVLAFVPTIVAQQNMVTLGQAGNLMFIPNTMTVNQGDNVTFAFMSAGHSVASTSLAQPNVADNQVYSGIIPVDNTTPTPPGTKLPNKNNRLKIRATFPERDTVVGFDLEERDPALGGLLAGKGGKATGNTANAGANANANTANANNANSQTTATQAAQNGNNLGNGVATFTIQMNQVGMQAMICDQAQHAANGMIMMINVLPSGSSQKRQSSSSSSSSDAALQQALTQYLAVGQNTKTTPATASPGTGGQLNAVAQQLGPTMANQNTKTGKKTAGAAGNAGANANANTGNAGAGGLAGLLNKGN